MKRTFNLLSFLFGVPGLLIGISSFSTAGPRLREPADPHAISMSDWGPWVGGALFVAGMVFYFLAQAQTKPKG